jgi:hypothetical protein
MTISELDGYRWWEKALVIIGRTIVSAFVVGLTALALYNLWTNGLGF